MTKREWVIAPGRFSELSIANLWAYRHLLYQLIYRDIISLYKQTILGPLWFFIQPIFTTTAFTLIFGNFAMVSADGIPRPLFYLAGIITWNYFSECLTKTSNVFRENIDFFGKIYFPRIIVPVSVAISVFARFIIQFILFIICMVAYYLTGYEITFTWAVCLFPLLISLTALQGLGLGMIISGLTVKYRDLLFLMSFGIQLLMYSTTVIYPLSAAPEDLKWIVQLSPMTAVIETFRFAFLGRGTFSWMALGYSGAISTLLVVCGFIFFNKAECKFIDLI